MLTGVFQIYSEEVWFTGKFILLFCFVLFPLNDFSTADLNAPPAENVCMPCNHLNVVAGEIQKLKLVQILQHHHYHVAAKMRENCVRIWKEKQLHVIRST